MEEIERLKQQNARLLQGLRQIRNRTLEEVALVCERVSDPGLACRELAFAIRSMKDGLSAGVCAGEPAETLVAEGMIMRLVMTGDLDGAPAQVKDNAPPTTSVAGLPDDWQLVMDEIDRATRMFPTWPTDPLHALAVLGEEFGELTKAVLQTAYEPHKVKEGELRTEAIQTAAMALRFLASVGRYEFVLSAQHAQS